MDVAYRNRELRNFCSENHNLQNEISCMYMRFESVASHEPQEIASCIAHYIKNIITRKLIMYDQNRNFQMSASNNFTVEIIHDKFLDILPNDQDFDQIEKTKYVPGSWIPVVSKTKKKNFLIQ